MKRLFERISKIFKLSVLSSSAKLCYYSYCLKFKPYRWLKNQQLREHVFKPTSAPMSEQSSLALKWHESVRLAARVLPFKADCLPRSLVLRDHLFKAGINAKLLIGVSKDANALNGFLSHAWVEVNGQAIGEAEDLKEKFRVVEDNSMSLETMSD